MSLQFLFFLDMDDTLVATSPAIQESYQAPYFWIHTARENNLLRKIKSVKIWNHIAKNPSFWETLSPKEDYFMLFLLAKKFDAQPKILTALPPYVFPYNKKRFLLAKIAKINWLNKYLPDISKDNILVTQSTKKHHYISQELNTVSILIDDNFTVCQKWIKQGGIAFQINARDTSQSVLDINRQLVNLLVFSEKCHSKKELLKYFHQLIA